MASCFHKYLFFPVILSVFLFSSCLLKIEKRKYRGGFHIEFRRQNQSPENHPLPSKERFLYTAKAPVDSVRTSAGNVPRQDQTTITKNDSLKTTSSSISHLKKMSAVGVPVIVNKTRPDPFQPVSGAGSPEKPHSFPYFISLIGLALVFTAWQLLRLFRSKNFQQLNNEAVTRPVKARWNIVLYSVLSGAVLILLSHVLPPLQPLFLNSLSVILIFGSGLAYLINESLVKEKRRRWKNRKWLIGLLGIGASVGFLQLFQSGIFSDVHFNRLDEEINENPVIFKVLLSLLLTAVLTGLLYLVVSAACELSCSGYQAAAVLLFSGGSFLLLFLFLLAIIHLWKKQSRGEDTKTVNKRITSIAVIIAAAVSAIATLLLFI